MTFVVRELPRARQDKDSIFLVQAVPPNNRLNMFLISSVSGRSNGGSRSLAMNLAAFLIASGTDGPSSFAMPKKCIIANAHSSMWEVVHSFSRSPAQRQNTMRSSVFNF